MSKRSLFLLLTIIACLYQKNDVTLHADMVLNWIWVGFFIIAFVIALVKLIFWGDFDVFPAMMDSTFSSSKTAFEISLGLTGVLSLWLGIMKIGEKGGVVNVLAKLLSPIFTKLFPDIPKGHPVTGSIFMKATDHLEVL